MKQGKNETRIKTEVNIRRNYKKKNKICKYKEKTKEVQDTDEIVTQKKKIRTGEVEREGEIIRKKKNKME